MAFERILVAYDGSDAARRALKRVPRLAAADGDVTVLMVVHAGLTSLGPRPLDPSAVEAAQRTLEEAYTFLTEQGVRVRAERAVGDPGERILEEAERRETDLVVVGSHGKRFVQRVVLGSVSAKVVGHARCDVLVVR